MRSRTQRRSRRARGDALLRAGFRVGVFVGLLGTLCAAARPAAAAPEARPAALRLSGIIALDEGVAREAAGHPPASVRERQAWAAGAVKRIVAAYRSREYPYARAWSRVRPDGVVHLHVDEGRMRVAFTGVRGVGAIRLRLGLHLPDDIFHLPTLTRALAEMKRSRNLLNVYYRVREPGEIDINPFDEAVPRRVLQIYVVTRDKVGWDLDISSSATWGLLVGLGFQRHVFWKDDRLRAKVEFAFPYRRYAFDADPSWQWVRGGLDLYYRFPRLVLKLAPRIDESLYVSHYDRHDLGIPSYYLLRSTSLASVMLLARSLSVTLGGGVDYMKALWTTVATDGTLLPGLPGDTTAVRGLGRLVVRLDSNAPALRQDYRSFVTARLDFAGSDEQQWVVDAEASARLFALVHRHRFIVRTNGRIMAGDVRFWDEAALANDYQRVFFANRYWVRQVLQIETAYRIKSWWERVDFGLFHDFSLFADRTRPGNPVAWANAFGPSLHLLLFDLFALDVYAGFGFAPVGFDHTVSFSFHMVF